MQADSFIKPLGILHVPSVFSFSNIWVKHIKIREKKPVIPYYRAISLFFPFLLSFFLYSYPFKSLAVEHCFCEQYSSFFLFDKCFQPQIHAFWAMLASYKLCVKII